MTNHPNRKPPDLLAHPSAELVKELFDETCLTQEGFGKLIHASRRTVQEWLSGTRRMPRSTMELLCLVLVVRRYHAAGEWMAPWVRPELLALLPKAKASREAVAA